jgi:hypothetical protein
MKRKMTKYREKIIKWNANPLKTLVKIIQLAKLILN